jgi:hypothetical protein
MDIGQILIGTAVAGLILFFWTGFTQNVLPWGIKSVQEDKNLDALTTQIKQISEYGVYYTHQDVAVFLAIKPASYYNMGRYFVLEFITQVFVGLILALILGATLGLSLETRLGIILLVGGAGVFSVDVQYWNWWGFSNIYTVGVAINRLLGYLIAGFVIANFIIR